MPLFCFDSSFGGPGPALAATAMIDEQHNDGHVDSGPKASRLVPARGTQHPERKALRSALLLVPTSGNARPERMRWTRVPEPFQTSVLFPFPVSVYLLSVYSCLDYFLF